MFVTQVFVATFIKCFSAILFEVLNSRTPKQKCHTLKSKDEIKKMLKNKLVSNLDTKENYILKSSCKVAVETFEKFLTTVCETINLKIYINLQLQENNLYRSFVPSIASDQCETIYITINNKGYVELNANKTILDDLSLSETEDESNPTPEETNAPTIILPDASIILPHAPIAKTHNCKRTNDHNPSDEHKPQEKKYKKTPAMKISQTKIRNPFLKENTQDTFTPDKPIISTASSDSINFENFVCTPEKEVLIQTVKQNLENLEGNLLKLQELLRRCESSMKQINENINNENNCHGTCDLHCNILAQANAIKKVKGRRTKPK